MVCTDMAMNVFFFSDENMHKIYVSYGKWDFIQNITQSVYSLIISQILQVFICYLTLTDKLIYQIKKYLFEKANRNIQIFNILRSIKIKLCIFYVFTFIFFLAYWYIVTSFCAVYKNTQIHLLTDTLISFGTSLLYPLGIYFIPGIFRITALKNKEKKGEYMYNFSKIIQLFC